MSEPECLSEETILSVLDKSLPAAELQSVLEHVDGCEGCRTLLAHATKSFRGPDQAQAVDRYQDLQVIGAGAMGVIYRAHDPLLHRQVALKILRHSAGPHASERVLKEAKAMARLSHPNVVTVYDAGIVENHVYLVMEYVDGESLAKWLKTPRPVGEVLERFVAAGRGLEAAHAAGLVHCDFKPANVLCGSGGRVRVTDFGLARLDNESDGHAAGTPAYMAPEQFQAGSADARSDQYSFCVALYEAIAGKRPDQGKPDRPIPTRLRRAIDRGLSKRPEDRFPSMAELLTAIGPSPSRRRATTLVALSLLSLAVVAGLHFRRARAPLCQGAGDRLAGIWDDAAKARIRDRLVATHVSYASDTWERVQRILDGYAAQWRAAYTEACEATHVRGEQSEALLDLRMECLRDRVREMKGVSDLLASADATVVEHAIDSAAHLDPIESCADASSLRRRMRPPKDATIRTRVEQIREQLSATQARSEAGDYAGALKLVQPTIAQARATEYLPVLAEALLASGQVQAQLGDLRSAETSLLEAAQTAQANQDDDVAARAWIALISFVGTKRDKVDPGLSWNQYAEAAIERLGRPKNLEAERALALAKLYRARGSAHDALEQFQRANELYQSTHNVGQAEALWGMASMYEVEGAHAQAVEAEMQGLALADKKLGETHPSLVAPIGHLGVLLTTEGHYQEALGQYERALAIGEKTLGSNNPANATIHSEMGQLLGRLGRADEGFTHLHTALAITQRAFGPEHVDDAAVLDNLGALYFSQAKYDAALKNHLRALGIFEKTVGPEHPRVGRCLHRIAGVFLAEKKFHEALDYGTRSLAILEKAYGPDARDSAAALTIVGQAQLGLGDPTSAIRSLRRALDLREERHASPSSIGESQFALAQALLDGTHDRAAAIELGRKARESFAQSRDVRARGSLANVESWLAHHR